MILDELIDQLLALRAAGHGETEVVMTADYGDRSHTTQALTIREVNHRETYRSGYSASDFAIKDGDSSEATESVVIALEG